MRRRLAAGLGAAALAGIGGALLAVACDPNNHLLVGEPYAPGATCLGVPAAIDDLAGNDPGESCSPECLVTTTGGAPAYFVTTTCPPYSPQYRAETTSTARDASDPCAMALAIYADGAICTGAAEAGADAALEAETGADGADAAAVDAATDADGSAAAEAAADSGADAGAG